MFYCRGTDSLLSFSGCSGFQVHFQAFFSGFRDCAQYGDGMKKFTDAASAAAAGYVVAHEPENSRFSLMQGEKKVGEAQYTLIGENAIDFDHTEVDAELRGTGLGEILADTATTHELVQGREIHASCGYMAAHLAKRD